MKSDFHVVSLRAWPSMDPSWTVQCDGFEVTSTLSQEPRARSHVHDRRRARAGSGGQHGQARPDTESHQGTGLGRGLHQAQPRGHCVYSLEARLWPPAMGAHGDENQGPGLDGGGGGGTLAWGQSRVVGQHQDATTI